MTVVEKPRDVVGGPSSTSSRPPQLLGFILVPMIEENLRRAMIISRDAIVSSSSLAVLLPNIRAKRDEVF